MTIETNSFAELSATNFRLALENRSLRADLTQLKALRKYEDSLEVERIKSAYAELETEVVELRREKLRRVDEVKLEESLSTPSTQSFTTDSEIFSLLKDQLRSEREKYKVLESKYDQLRRDALSCDNSTTASGSPLCYRELFSIEKSEQVNIKPIMEEMFKRPTRSQRPVIPLAEVHGSTTVVPVVPPQPVRNTVAKGDASIQRLAKIAKYRGN